MINMKNLDSNKIKIDEKTYRNIFICYTRYVTFKDLRYVKINSVNPLYLFVGKINKCFETIKQSRDIRSENNNSDDYDEKYMKIKSNSDDDLP